MKAESRGVRRRLAGVVAMSMLAALGVVATSIATTQSAAAATDITTSTPKVNDKTPRVGQILTVRTGTWTPSDLTFSYQWYRGATTLDGATGATYQVQAADLGSRLRVQVTGGKDGLSPATRLTSWTAKVARGFIARPTPVISKTSPVVDDVLSVDTSGWGPAPVSLTYQWYKVSSKGKVYKLKGATAATYQVKASDKGYRLKVKVYAAKEGYYSTSRTSAKTAKVVQYSFTEKPKPLVTGKVAPGGTLSADAGAWAPAADSLSFQWKRAGAAIDGETGSTHQIVDADLGRPLTVTVTAAKPGYATASTTSSPVTAVGPDVDLHVGTFNLSGMNTDSSASGDHEVWAKRMPVAVSQVLAERLDVLGVQEAYWGTSYPQYTQLRDALNDAGGTYQLVDADKSSSAGDRILYNPTTLELGDHGVYQYSAQTSGRQTRYLVWAVFLHKDSGKRFFFADTHLDPYTKSVKLDEWRELIREIPKLNADDLPVVSVGDFNTSKWWDEAKEFLPAMKAAGFGDVMNQQFQTNPPVGVRAQSVENGWINSFNGYRRDVTKYSYPTNHAKVGNGVDWIFAENSLAVKKWKVVINFDPNTLKIEGVIPSDHCMLSATLVL